MKFLLLCKSLFMPLRVIRDLSAKRSLSGEQQTLIRSSAEWLGSVLTQPGPRQVDFAVMHCAFR